VYNFFNLDLFPLLNKDNGQFLSHMLHKNQSAIRVNKRYMFPLHKPGRMSMVYKAPQMTKSHPFLVSKKLIFCNLMCSVIKIARINEHS